MIELIEAARDMTQTDHIPACTLSRSDSESQQQQRVQLRCNVDARTASRVLIPGRNGSVKLHDDATLIIDVDPAERELTASLELAGHRFDLLRIERIDIALHTTRHVDVTAPDGVRLLAVSMNGGEPRFVHTNVPTLLGLPGGTYELPTLAGRGSNPAPQS